MDDLYFEVYRDSLHSWVAFAGRTSARVISRNDVPQASFTKRTPMSRDGSITGLSKKSHRSSLEERMSRNYSDQAMLISAQVPDGDVSDLTNALA